jgi:glucokinase
MDTLLAADIGGTKTLLALYESTGQTLELLAEKRYSSADWDALTPMVQRFLNTAGTGMPGGVAQPAAACFAVAGPVQGGKARLTNLPWLVDQNELAAAIGIGASKVELVNDFAVLIYGLPHLQPQQQAVVRPGCADPDGTLLVLGAGTGLGVAYGLRTPQGLLALASEAAHGEFAPRNDTEWRLKCWLQANLGLERLSIERVVSGTGLGHVGRWLLQERHADGSHPLQRDPPPDLPAAVAQAAEAGDPLAEEALELWLGAYGSVCGDLALMGLSRGGIWLAGGTAGKLLQALREPSFSQAFLAKGRLASVLDAMPITAITDPAIGQFSAACRARMLSHAEIAAPAN